MNANQGKDMKGTRPDQNVDDPSKDLTATAGQQQGNQQSGQQKSGQQQSGQQQGNQQSGQQQGGQHASGGTPALDDPDQRQQGESARDASQAFNQQQDKGNR